MTHRERWLVALLLLGYVATGIFYALDNPLYLKPDEYYHFVFVQHLLDGKGLPSVDTSRVGVGNHSPVEAEGHQPPLYYAAVAAIATTLGLQEHLVPANNPHFLSTQQGNRHVWTPLYAKLSQVPIFVSGRLLSLLCGVIALIFIYRLARRYLSSQVALLSVALIGLNPQFLFIATSFSNDMASVMTIHIGLWMIVVVSQERLTWRWSALLGVVIALATLTKIGGMGLFAPLGVVALWQAWKDRHLRTLLYAALAFLVWLALCSWWLWRNWLLYHDPLTTTLLPVLLGARTDPFMGEGLLSYLTFVWKAYWLDFSPGGILFAEVGVYWVIAVVCLVGLTGSVWVVVRKASLRPLFWLLWGWFALVFVSLLRLTSGTAVFMGGGRLLFPATASVGITLAVGLYAVGVRRWLLPGLIAVCWACALIAPFRYLHTTYPRPQLVESLSTEPAFPVHARFEGDSFELIGYDLKQVKLAPGEAKNGAKSAVDITYYWQAINGSQQNFSLFVQWLDPQQLKPISQIDTYPGYGTFPTSAWQPGSIFVDTVRLYAPEETKITDGILLTGLYDLSTMRRLVVVRSAQSQTERDAICLATVGKFDIPDQFASWRCPTLKSK
ncbi:MAG: glycosyltransferase family 39 protein [Caldilineaceae bacterium]